MQRPERSPVSTPAPTWGRSKNLPMSESERHDLYRGRVLHLTREHVALPNGHEVDLEIIHHPGASAVVPLTAAGEVVLIRQYRHAGGGFLIEIPAGKLDPGEPPQECAARELTEEAGVIAGRLTRLGSILTTPGFADEVIHLYLGEDLVEAKTHHEPSEVITLLRRPLAACLEMIAAGEIVDSKTICALFLADQHVRRRSR